MTLHPDFGHGLITASTRMLLLSHPEIPVVHAELRYCREEPLAVHLVLSVEDVPATWWTFGRDLLITGTAMPSGLGDVQVYPTDDFHCCVRAGMFLIRLLGPMPNSLAIRTASSDSRQRRCASAQS